MVTVDTNTSEVAKTSALQAAGLLVGFAAVIAGYIVLCRAIGNAEFYAGFLFLAFWMLMEQGRMDRLAHTVLGVAFGLALACLLRFLVTGPLGATTGGLFFVAALVPVVYLQILGHLSLFINGPAMATLTALTIPYVQEHADFVQAAIALAVACVYFGLIISIARRAARPSPSGD
jgi:hypothetical protein